MGKKSIKSSGRMVTLGPDAYSFYDASLGLQVSRGEVKELKPNQLNSIKVRRALTAGHLEYVAEASIQEDLKEDKLQSLNTKLLKFHSEGMEISKMAKAFTLEEVTSLALEEYGITAENDDTVETIIAAVVEEIESNK